MKSFARAQSNYDNMLPVDTSRIDDAIEREGERIANDDADLRKVLIEALSDDPDLDKQLVEVRLALRDAISALGSLKISNLSVDQAKAYNALVLLARKSDDWVAQAIEQEAATRVVLDKEGGR